MKEVLFHLPKKINCPFSKGWLMFSFIISSVKKLAKAPFVKLCAMLFTRRKKPVRKILSGKMAVRAAKNFARSLPSTMMTMAFGLVFDLAFLAFEMYLLRRIRHSA